MRSVTIKDLTGKKLIKVWHDKNGYFVEADSSITPFDVLIVTPDKERITVPMRKK